MKLFMHEMPNILNLNISFETYNIAMFDILFSVKAEVTPSEVIKVVGCLPQLGAWNPLLAPPLIFKKGTWEGVKIRVQHERKFQFKLVKIKQNGTVTWQELPNNSNRKIKPKCHSKLQLVWSSPEGKISALTRNSIKLNGIPGAMKIDSKARSNKGGKKLNEQFDPYRNAHDDGDSDSEQEQDFTLIKRKMSDEITINSSDLQEIYYNSCPIEIYWDLFKKMKLYIISSEIDDMNNPYLDYVDQQLKQLPSTCMVKWITSDCLLTNNDKHHSNHRKIKKRDSIFEVKQEQLHIESLYSRTSYFMFLQIETAVKFKGKTGHVPACLFVPSSKYDEILNILPFMSHIQLICFDQPSANKAYLEYLKGYEESSSGGENETGVKLSIANPSIIEIIEALKELKYRDTVILNTLGSMIEHDALKLIENQNTVTIADSELVQNYPSFTQKIVQRLHHYSLLVIVAQNELTQSALQYRQTKNVVLVYNNFEKIILEGKQYHPLRNCRQTIDLLMMKIKLYQQNYGGEIHEKAGSLIYHLPEGRHQMAVRIETQFKAHVSKYTFIKISLKGTRIKITWNLATQARILRTICQIKYTNFGVLGNFSIISDRLNLRELKDALRLLIQHCPKLFLAKHETKVRYFSYGSGQAATCHILPESTEQQRKYELER